MTQPQKALSFALTLAVVLTAGEAFAFRAGWTWNLPAEKFKKLNFTNRQGVKRAGQLYEEAWNAQHRQGKPFRDLIPLYRAAAGEWRKVQIKFETVGFDESLIAYTTFMQGYCLQAAKDTNEAIKKYEEVMEIYGEERWISLAAKYHLAMTRLGLGDTKMGNNILREMVDDPDGGDHPLVAVAIHKVALLEWYDDKKKKAMGLWERLVDKKNGFYETAHDTWETAQNCLRFTILYNGDFVRFAQFYYDEVDPNNHKQMCETMFGVLGNMGWLLGGGNTGIRSFSAQLEVDYKKPSERNERYREIVVGRAKWLDAQRHIAVAAGREDEYEMKRFYTWLAVPNLKDLEKRIVEIRAVIARQKDPAVFSRWTHEIIGFFHGRGRLVEAGLMIETLRDPNDKLWMRKELAKWQGKWDEALQLIEQYLKIKLPEGRVKEIKYEKAHIYRYCKGDLETAIKLYIEIDDPPRSLWELQGAQRASPKHRKEAFNTLVEIASIFEDQAPRAVYTQACYYEQDGMKEKAIALYKRLLSQPEWKTLGESSAAHQALERLGVATGGAMTNTVR